MPLSKKDIGLLAKKIKEDEIEPYDYYLFMTKKQIEDAELEIGQIIELDGDKIKIRLFE